LKFMTLGQNKFIWIYFEKEFKKSKFGFIWNNTIYS